jgi:hypothetical protein
MLLLCDKNVNRGWNGRCLFQIEMCFMVVRASVRVCLLEAMHDSRVSRPLLALELLAHHANLVQGTST